jgi:hypothetical protein
MGVFRRMFQISTDISSLTQGQREAVASFILSFPSTTEDVFTMDAVTITPEDDEPSADEVFGDNNFKGFVPVVNESPAFESGLDRNGLPWDERIHASSRAKTADGSWRAKRNVEPALVTKVEGELKALMALPAAPPAPAAIPAPPGQTTVSVAETTTVPATASVPPPPPPAANTWVAFISEVSGKIAEGKLSEDNLKLACAQAGVPTFSMLGTRQDLIPAVQANIRLLSQ